MHQRPPTELQPILQWLILLPLNFLQVQQRQMAHIKRLGAECTDNKLPRHSRISDCETHMQGCVQLGQVAGLPPIQRKRAHSIAKQHRVHMQL